MKFPLRSMLLIAASAITLAACESNNTGPTQAAYDTLQGQYDALQQDYEAALAEKSQIEADLASKVAEVATLTAQLDDANADIAALTTQIAGLEAEIADLESQLDAANARIRQLSTANAALQAQLNDFNTNAYRSLQDKQNAAAQPATAAAYQAAISDLAAKQATKDAAQAVLTEAVSYTTVIGLADADNKTVANLTAENADAAAMYCTIVTCANDQVAIDAAAYSAGLLPGADNDVINDLEAAVAALATSQTAYNTAEGNYQGMLGKVTVSSPETLYDANGNEISAFGAFLTSSTPGANPTDTIPIDARITALFLVDAGGDLTDIVVFEATGNDNPFNLPVGAATFTSDQMVAYFAHQEGTASNGSYAIDYDGSAGSLSLDFNTNAGILTVGGVGGSNDYAITANLTFDPATGAFSGSGTQSYTAADDVGQANGTVSSAAGDAGQAVATITGQLVGASDAFIASIEAVDDYTTTLIDGIGNTPDPTATVNVSIATEIIGSGTYSQPQP